MRFLILLILPFIMTTDTGYIIDFGETKDGTSWRIVNDGVMGGLSQSNAMLTSDSVKFSGTVSLENNGGFASIRTLIPEQSLANCKTMTIRYKSNSLTRTFGLSLKNSQRYYIPYYKHTFSPKTKDWQELKVNLNNFKHYRISQVIGDSMPSNALDDVYNIAIIISDKISGPFDIEIDYIKFE